MAIFEYKENKMTPLETTDFQKEGIKERENLQEALRQNIEVVSPNTLVISEEFRDWDASNRRIDLLGIDKEANLVVIELKRTNDGSHMELQAIRYAAMASTMTFEQAVHAYSKYSKKDIQYAREGILDHLDWDEEVYENLGNEFNSKVRIVLVSAGFKKEITTSVMWLNQLGLDIRCVRLEPFKHKNNTFIDVQEIIPLKEAREYLIHVMNKANQQVVERTRKRDSTKYNLDLGGEKIPELSNKGLVFEVVRHALINGIEPDKIDAGVEHSHKMRWVVIDQECADANEFVEIVKGGGKNFSPARYFTREGEVIPVKGRTYTFRSDWTKDMVDETVKAIVKLMPNQITVERATNGQY